MCLGGYGLGCSAANGDVVIVHEVRYLLGIRVGGPIMGESGGRCAGFAGVGDESAYDCPLCFGVAFSSGSLFSN